MLVAEKVLKDNKGEVTDRRYMDASLPVEERVESLLAVMTPEDKMELIREGWGIPGIPHLYVPPITKVEAVHGFSYGSGATIFPQALAMGATWNRKLTEEVAMVIGDETVVANTKQAWSPVLDVAQDARWGRCEETFGEDPVLVSQIGGAWIKGINPEDCLLLRNILADMVLLWVDVTHMISVCRNVKCVKYIWFHSVTSFATTIVSL